MTSPGNQHCASCIGTLSFPTAGRLVTRSCATAEGPRDALCRFKSCQLYCTRRTSCTTNPQQIAVMELEGTKVDRLVVNSHDSSIVLQVSSTSSTVDDDEFCWQRDRLAVATFFKSGVWTIRRELRLFLQVPELSYSTVYDEGSSNLTKNQLDSFIRFNRTPTCEGQTHDDSIRRASSASRSKN